MYSILIIALVILSFIGISNFNKKVDAKILNDIRHYFEDADYQVIKIESITGKKIKDAPFNTREWSLSTGTQGKEYYANLFWKVFLKDKENKESMKWVNTGHFFLYKVYFIVKE